MDAAAGREAVGAATAGDVAGVAAAGDEQQAGLRAPAVLGTGADLLGEVRAASPIPASEPQLATPRS